MRVEASVANSSHERLCFLCSATGNSRKTGSFETAAQVQAGAVQYHVQIGRGDLQLLTDFCRGHRFEFAQHYRGAHRDRQVANAIM